MSDFGRPVAAQVAGDFVDELGDVMRGQLDFDNFPAIDFRVEQLASDPSATEATQGRLFYNTTDEALRYVRGGPTPDIVTLPEAASGVWHQGGDSFGALGVLGTTDANDLSIIRNGSEEIRVSANGVGIGKVPTDRFNVQEDQNGNTILRVENQTVGTTARANITVESDAGSGGITATSSGFTTAGALEAAMVQLAASTGMELLLRTVGADDIIFAPNDSPAMRLTSAGRLGIGTASPSTPLHVAGAATIDGKLTVGGLIDPTGLVLDEQASRPDSVVAGKGQLWIRNDTPNVLIFTDDAGTDNVVDLGGSPDPGGADGEVQFNDGGAFGGDAQFAWDKTGNILTVQGQVRSGSGSGSNNAGSRDAGFTVDGLELVTPTAGVILFDQTSANDVATSGIRNYFARARGAPSAPADVQVGDLLYERFVAGFRNAAARDSVREFVTVDALTVSDVSARWEMSLRTAAGVPVTSIRATGIDFQVNPLAGDVDFVAFSDDGSEILRADASANTGAGQLDVAAFVSVANAAGSVATEFDGDTILIDQTVNVTDTQIIGWNTNQGEFSGIGPGTLNDNLAFYSSGSKRFQLEQGQMRPSAGARFGPLLGSPTDVKIGFSFALADDTGFWSVSGGKWEAVYQAVPAYSVYADRIDFNENAADRDFRVFGDTGLVLNVDAAIDGLGFFAAAPVGQQGPLTAQDASVVDATYGTEEEAVIKNNRTRIDELETALQNLGLIT